LLKRAGQVARAVLVAPLRLVPAVVMRKVQGAYTSGRMRWVSRPLVAVLRHRPFGPIEAFAVPGAPRVRMVTAESRAIRQLYWCGVQEHAGVAAEIWRDLCRNAGTVVELGANIGFFTVVGAQAQPAGSVYTAVEAHPGSAQVLRRNVELNGLSHVTVIHAAALDVAEPGHAELAVPDHDRDVAPTGGYVVGHAEGVAGRPTARTIRVPTVPAAGVLAQADLVTLDVEGCEAAILEAAAENVLARRATVMVKVQRSPGRLRSLLLRFHTAGYVVFAVGRSCLHLLTTSQLYSTGPLPLHDSRDVLLIPAESAAKL